MNYCESCQQLEGDTEQDEDGIVVCKECGEPVVRVPDHDDGDER